ncbi:MAG: LysR family transcriptional regulator [Rhodobacteraceae bacterium]|nr:LysR family transcriptional regulator [Paracoccaceae bacterium]
MQIQRRLIPSTSALTAFEAVARLGSFTDAARELDLTQSAVSRQVLVLEDQLQCRLFDRDSRNVALTVAGRDYAQEVRQALSIIRRASVEAVSNTQKRVLRLAILPTFGTRWLMPRIPRFVEKHPDVTLSFTSRIGWFDFSAQDLDAAIIHGTPDWPHTEATLLMQEAIVPVAAPELLRRRPVRLPEDIVSLPRLNLHSRPAEWQRWFEANGIKAPSTNGMMFEQISTLSQACVGGVGVALMPEFLIKGELRNGELERIGEPISSEGAYYLVQPQLHARNPAADVFRDWLKSEIDPRQRDES